MTIKRSNPGLADTTPGLPQRPGSHITGEQAVLALRNALPREWLFRETQPDYGIDCEIEIVCKAGRVTGAIVKGQIKGTTFSEATDKLGLRVSTNSVRYWLALPVPVVLFLVTQNPNKVLWLDVRQYLLERERLDTLYSTKQKSQYFGFHSAYSLPDDVAQLQMLALEHQSSVAEMRVAEEADLPAQYMVYVILIKLYDGDVNAWIQWLREKGSEDQLIHDFPFAVWVKRQLQADPDLLTRIREMVEEST